MDRIVYVQQIGLGWIGLGWAQLDGSVSKYLYKSNDKLSMMSLWH